MTHVVLTHKHFDHVLGSSVFAEAETYCAPEVIGCLSTATDQLRDDALRYGADADEIDRAIAALRAPQHGIDNAVVDLGNRGVTIAHLGRGDTTSDLVVVVPGDDGGRVVVFCGDLIEESATRRSMPTPMWRRGRPHLTGACRWRTRRHLRAGSRECRRCGVRPPSTGLAEQSSRLGSERSGQSDAMASPTRVPRSPGKSPATSVATVESSVLRSGVPPVKAPTMSSNTATGNCASAVLTWLMPV